VNRVLLALSQIAVEPVLVTFVLLVLTHLLKVQLHVSCVQWERLVVVVWVNLSVLIVYKVNSITSRVHLLAQTVPLVHLRL